MEGLISLWRNDATTRRSSIDRSFHRIPARTAAILCVRRWPVFGGIEKFQSDPYWRDLIPFNEYFHGDNGAGIGASHQTGWTALVAKLIQQYGE